MVISKKPEQKNINNKLIDQILTRGGSVARAKRESEDDNANIKITIRIPKKMLQTIDTFLNSSIYSKPRNVWIKDAIEKKIKVYNVQISIRANYFYKLLYSIFLAQTSQQRKN